MRSMVLVGLLLCFGNAEICYSASGQEIWADQCARCHGADGKAQTPMGKKRQLKDLTDPKVQAQLKDDEMAARIREGKRAGDGETLMPPAKNVSDDDIKALIQIARGFKQ